MCNLGGQKGTQTLAAYACVVAALENFNASSSALHVCLYSSSLFETLITLDHYDIVKSGCYVCTRSKVARFHPSQGYWR